VECTAPGPAPYSSGSRAPNTERRTARAEHGHPAPDAEHRTPQSATPGGHPSPLSAMGGEWDLLDQLTQLRRCSLIMAEEVSVPPGWGNGRAGIEMRFRMLNTVREYAEQQLSVEESATLRRRHRDWFLELAVAAEGEIYGPN